MEREKLLEEYKVVLESLVEKVKFCYSEEFHKLDDFDKQKYQKDKMTTEAHLSTLCEILWGNKMRAGGSTGSLFALGLLWSMMGYNNSFDGFYPNLEGSNKSSEDAKKEKESEPIYVIPTE